VKSRILIVDDDEGFLTILGAYLSARGFEPQLAGSAMQARHYLNRSHFDAILSDFQMPGETGLDLLRYIKTQYAGLPFFLMTGAGSTRLKREAMQMGSAGYIEKPFKISDLVTTMASFQTPADHETKELAS
jgi:two-component system phosphate regulon response regulator OmpR